MQLLLIIDIMRLFFLIKITEARRFIDLLELILTTWLVKALVLGFYLL